MLTIRGQDIVLVAEQSVREVEIWLGSAGFRSSHAFQVAIKMKPQGQGTCSAMIYQRRFWGCALRR